MSDPVSIRELILRNVVTVLEAISTANGYQVNVQEVFRVMVVNSNVTEYPAIVVVPESETKTETPLLCYQTKMIINLECYVDELENVSEEVNILLADVEKALMVDHTRGGNAIDTTLIGADFIYGEDTKPYGVAIAMIEIVYRTRTTDPFSIQ